MSYVEHALLEIAGTNKCVAADDEIWACGIRVMQGTQASPTPNYYVDADIATELPTIASRLATWFASSAGYMANTAKLTTVKLNNIGPAGKYAGTTAHTYQIASPAVGYLAQGSPSFCSAVFSWRGNRTIGKATHGRIYPPNYTVAANGGSIGSSYQASMVGSAQALLKVLLDYTFADGSALIPCIVSSSGSFQAITSVRVANVLDVQRRRKNGPTPTYASGPIAP